MKKRRRIGRSNGESPLPVVTIQHIQSYMSGKDAARTTLLSKSWHAAWLTRPSLDFDALEFCNHGGLPPFKEYATRTMKRYQDLNLNIESFKLRMYECSGYLEFHNLIVEAMKLGADDVDVACARTLPLHVIASQNLLRLSLTWCTLDDGRLSCPNLKSLTFNYVNFTRDDVFCSILTSCSASIQELTLSNSSNLGLARMNLVELHKLRRLFLFSVEVVPPMFKKDFASRFPCLNELSIRHCRGCNALRIDSPSLRTITFELEPLRGRSNEWSAEFDVPNIRKFTYSGWDLPSSMLYIKAAASREWEFDISIHFSELQDSTWFLKLKKYVKKYLKRYRLLRISLSVILIKSVYKHQRPPDTHENGVKIEVAREPLVIDNLIIYGSSTYLCALVVRLFGICRPKFITHCREHDNDSLDFLCKRQSMFGQFGLKEVKVELLPSDASQTSANKQKILYHLIWNE